MKLFIYEYFASGAMEDHDELKEAGYAMLDAVLKDFTRILGLKIITLLDVSLKDKILTTDYVQELEIDWKRNQVNLFKLFEKQLAKCDGVLIIAPETAGILAKLTAMAESWGKIVLGSCSQALEVACNKAETYNLMKSKGLPVPQSEVLKRPFGVDTKTEILDNFSFPLVIKPAYGTGGEGVRLIRNEEQLDKELGKLAIMEKEPFLVQEYILGQAVSVSLFVLDGKVLPLSLNKQIINHEDELIFHGITVPYIHHQVRDIIKLATGACEQVKGLKGFVGVDLVVCPQGPVLIEINPRITLAYVALREVVLRNLAHDLLILCQEQSLLEKPEIRGTYTYHLKIAQTNKLSHFS